MIRWRQKKIDVPDINSNNYLTKSYSKFGSIVEEDPITYNYLKRVPDSETFDVVKYWKEYYDKALATVEIEFLSIPASSSNVKLFFYCKTAGSF